MSFLADPYSTDNGVGLFLHSFSRLVKADLLTQAVSFLAKAGVNLKSLRLSEMAVRMQQETTVGTDPLKFVKDMTEKMINDLQKEDLAETSQKGRQQHK